MGHIYKIQNKINNKVYIGQTIKPVEKRFNQHKANYGQPYFSHLSLYKAFIKYGIENFSFEEIEEVPNELLDEREKYWIKFYNSYSNGYNSTLGGRETALYDWDINEIIRLYYEKKSARKVAEIIGCDHSTIDRILNENNIKRFSLAEMRAKENIILRKDSIDKIFSNATEAAEWLISNSYTKTTNIKNVARLIRAAGNNKTKYFGFEVYYESKI